MKILKLIFALLSLLVFLPLSAQTLKTVEANPINVAVMLMQRADTASMSKSLRYYGYQEILTPDTSKSDASKVYSHPNGSTIRYKYTDPTQSFPTVELTSKVPFKEREQILQNLKFEKVGNAYEQKSIGYSTRCQFGPHGTLILTRISKTRE